MCVFWYLCVTGPPSSDRGRFSLSLLKDRTELFSLLGSLFLPVEVRWKKEKQGPFASGEQPVSPLCDRVIIKTPPS